MMYTLILDFVWHFNFKRNHVHLNKRPIFFLKGKIYYSEGVIFFHYFLQVAYIKIVILMPRV